MRIVFNSKTIANSFKLIVFCQDNIVIKYICNVSFFDKAKMGSYNILMSLDRLQQLKQKTDNDNLTQQSNTVISSNQIPNYSQGVSQTISKPQTQQPTEPIVQINQPKTDKGIKSNSKLPKFILPVIVVITLLGVLITAGVMFYPSFFSSNLFAGDKDLLRGKLTKLDKDYDLIIKPQQKEGVDCSSDPKIQEEKGISVCEPEVTFQYYSAGVYNKGKYKDYTRILMLEPRSGLMSIFATKDDNKFIFNGDPSLKDKQPEDDTYIYKVIKKDKIEDIAPLPQEFNQFLEINDQFVLSSTVIDKGIFCPVSLNEDENRTSCNLIVDPKKLKEVGQTKNSTYKIYTSLEGEADRYYVYDQTETLYTSFINQKSLIEKNLLQDEEGKKIAQLIDKKTSEEEIKKQFPSYTDRSKICQYYLSFTAGLIETNQPVLANYNYNPESCELINLSPNNYSSKLKLVDIKESELEVVGQIKGTKTNIYKYKSNEHPNLIEYKANLELEGANIEEDMKKNPLLLVQDPFGRFFQLQGSSNEAANQPQISNETVVGDNNNSPEK